MAGITTRITFYVMVACLLTGIIGQLNIIPNVNTMPALDSQGTFAKTTIPDSDNAGYQNPFVGFMQMAWNAINAFIGALVCVVYIVPTLSNWGLDIAWIAGLQTALLTLYGYDAIAIWKGWDPL